ncbi:hypothetical protein BU14_0023s0013 [Porphyra umbilicalis]|uniref:Uncharacterized protein n=1 Tax=Porphyra umbilicalis TaxID=2786 RepID=A0A1X6PKH0_PORUM|nr:hypothetical protein BU14_0023s0013 [Porphyra umbilicalis]|eukprot:OSX81208.1 hypothetical protein BU14_0023s0013 [Porphyra umbilicalis]
MAARRPSRGGEWGAVVRAAVQEGKVTCKPYRLSRRGSRVRAQSSPPTAEPTDSDAASNPPPQQRTQPTADPPHSRSRCRRHSHSSSRSRLHNRRHSRRRSHPAHPPSHLTDVLLVPRRRRRGSPCRPTRCPHHTRRAVTRTRRPPAPKSPAVTAAAKETRRSRQAERPLRQGLPHPPLACTTPPNPKPSPTAATQRGSRRQRPAPAPTPRRQPLRRGRQAAGSAWRRRRPPPPLLRRQDPPQAQPSPGCWCGRPPGGRLPTSARGRSDRRRSLREAALRRRPPTRCHPWAPPAAARCGRRQWRLLLSVQRRTWRLPRREGLAQSPPTGPLRRTGGRPRPPPRRHTPPLDAAAKPPRRPSPDGASRPSATRRVAAPS